MSGRYLRSKYWRNLLFESADGRCVRCGQPLDMGWHADHVTPYSVAQSTDPFDMQALCPKCNINKGNRMQPDWLQIDRSKLREGQRNAIDTILMNVREGKQNTAIVLPPAYGKSHVIRIAATMLMCQQLVSCALVLVPAENLRGQVVDASLMQAAVDRYNLPRIRGQRISAHEVKEFRLPFPPPRHKNDNFFAATIQLVNSNLPGFVRWVMQEKQEKTCRPSFSWTRPIRAVQAINEAML